MRALEPERTISRERATAQERTTIDKRATKNERTIMVERSIFSEDHMIKLKLFNGVVTNISLNVLAGGYDPETSRVVLIVRGDNDAAGNMTLDVAEAHRWQR